MAVQLAVWGANGGQAEGKLEALHDPRVKTGQPLLDQTTVDQKKAPKQNVHSENRNCGIDLNKKGAAGARIALQGGSEVVESVQQVVGSSPALCRRSCTARLRSGRRAGCTEVGFWGQSRAERRAWPSPIAQ